HLKEVKRIFRYLRGTVNMGLWYSKGSSFELIAFSDADHAGCIDSRKRTSGGIQFLGDKLVNWMSKKHNCTAVSLAEAEYVALSASCDQVITEYHLADMFTKGLPKDRFKYLVRRIVLWYDEDECDKGRMPTKIELAPEQSQQGVSNDVLNIRVIPKYHSEDGNPARANIKQALGRSLQDLEVQVKMEMEIRRSNGVYFITA
nr:uncharacterized mitochondrial protein AtMg00810-like [Tanacetum cinerariifolium]